ncbi:hypothetical protein HYN59_01460 [Flavobacterium album]|uniref:Uncharacterized protein n=1 Tax=Flavobacterium album TaxID=2175091 RepID=A0A2S1QU14_9FLAO|nr:hypothetical protein [Flavobacterium album]AWH83863.1 hypothetical protein HYN59_01460 [Flavobacterium album]
MKNINYMNYAMVGIPLFLIGVGWLINPDMIISGLLFTIVTDAFQLIVGIGLFIDSGYRDSYLGVYLIGVAIFFALWIFIAQTWIIAIPPLLALYLSIIIFTKAKHAKP